VTSLIKILLAAFLAFMVLAIVQERNYFLAAWFGEAAAPTEASEADIGEAESALRMTFALMRHLYASGGDPRFSDRMPASPSIVQEMLADIEYLGGNGRVQDPLLQHLEVLEAIPIDEDSVELRTKEYWRIRFLRKDGQGEADPAQGHMLYGRYLVRRDAAGWRVEDWEFAEPPAAEAGSP